MNIKKLLIYIPANLYILLIGCCCCSYITSHLNGPPSKKTKKSHALKQIEEGNINGNIVKKNPVNYKMKLWKKYARSDLIKWGWGLGCG